jgi:methionyl-tRNA formyltransferase
MRLSKKTKTVIMGDEIGLPTLKIVSEQANLAICAVVWSKKIDNPENKLFPNVPQIQFTKNEPGPLIEFIHKEEIELLLVYSFDVILPRKVLDIPGLKCVNIHGGELPKYRGANILNWVLIEGQNSMGITMHEIDEGVDSGPVISQSKLLISDGDTALTLRSKIDLEVRQSLPGVLIDYISGTILPVRQEVGAVRPYKRRKEDDGLFDWSWSDKDIYNLVRALVFPWPGARFLNKRGNLEIIQSFMTLEQISALRRRETE